MILLDALEIKIEQDPDVEDRQGVDKFNWDVLNFDKDFIELQINFENPNEIGVVSSKDYISITFWGVNLFTSSQGVEVEFG